MIGKYQIQLGAEQLTSGMSSSDFATDGALGVSSVGLNPFVIPGTVYPMASPTDISTNVADNIIASCEDSNATAPNNRYMLGDAANYYMYSGSSITLETTGSATFVAGKADLAQFNGALYASASSYLVKWTLPATINETYKTFVDGNAHHPLLNYINYLYFGDGNILCTLDTGGTVVTRLTLPPKEKIVALGIDPATGLMLISVETVYDVSDTIPSLKAVYLYDGISAQYTRKILVDDLVTAFYNVEGFVYVGCGPTIGQWNGNGVTFLRLLKNVSLTNTDLPYKHHFSNINRVLHVIDGSQVLSYGAVTSQKRGFFYTAGTQVSSTSHLTCIFPAGNSGGTGERLGIAYKNSGPVYKVFTFDYGSIASGAGTLYFNNIYFPRPIFVHRMRIITTGIAHSGSTDMNIIITTEKGATLPISSANRIVSVPTGTTYVLDFDFGGGKCQAIQPSISMSNNTYGIVRVYVYYDIAE